MESLNKVAFGFMLVLVVALMCGSRSVSGLFLGKTSVHINNTISPSTVFTYHCKSSNDDLGVRTLNYLEDWHWKFQTDYFDSTHFFCEMWWAETNRGRHAKGSFDLYVAKRDEVVCYHSCRYYAKADGIYLYNLVKKRLDLIYAWPK